VLNLACYVYMCVKACVLSWFKCGFVFCFRRVVAVCLQLHAIIVISIIIY